MAWGHWTRYIYGDIMSRDPRRWREARMDIEIKTLTTCNVGPDGHTLELSFIDAAGRPALLRLPFESAQAMATTLPNLLTQAVQRMTGQEGSRYVFPLDAWRLDSCDDLDGAIAALATTDGFAVSFGIPTAACRSLGWALKSQAEPEDHDGPAGGSVSPDRLN